MNIGLNQNGSKMRRGERKKKRGAGIAIPSPKQGSRGTTAGKKPTEFFLKAGRGTLQNSCTRENVRSLQTAAHHELLVGVSGSMAQGARRTATSEVKKLSRANERERRGVPVGRKSRESADAGAIVERRNAAAAWRSNDRSGDLESFSS